MPICSANLFFSYNRNKVTQAKADAPVYYLHLDYPEAYPHLPQQSATVPHPRP